MNPKLWLARLLAPGVFRKAGHYERLVRKIDDGKQWLAHDFPGAGAFAKYLLVNDHIHWRRPGERPVLSPWRESIGQFREQLRRGKAPPI
jgi:hypothetical protein